MEYQYWRGGLIFSCVFDTPSMVLVEGGRVIGGPGGPAKRAVVLLAEVAVWSSAMSYMVIRTPVIFFLT